MQLRVHTVHRVFTEGLQVLPAGQLTDPSQRGVRHVKVTAVPLAKYRTFHVCRLQFAPRLDQLALVVKQEL